MNRNIKNVAAMMLLALVGVAIAAGSAGCDEVWGTGLGFVDPWYTSGYYGVPGTTYYDPTNEIQGAVDYRLDAMETAANGWDEFIRQ